MPTKEEVLNALRTCQEPELHNDIVSLGMVQNLVVDGGKVSFDYVLTTPACPFKGMMELRAREAVLKVSGVKEVDIRMTANVKRDMRLERILPVGVKNIIAVGSGKGGVGKSTIACNLAVSLALDGAKVGLMDADIYGPNQPQMMGLDNSQPTLNDENKIEPPQNYGVKVMSMGLLMESESPVIWRGPMLHGAITQFLKDVNWGHLDYLVIDLPPGTGDVQLSLCQVVPLTDAVIVTTPQTIALSDVRKAVGMFQKLHVPILGVVENMYEFVCPHCRKTSEIFSRGGGADLAKKYGVEVLGSIPIDPAVCQTGETGKPAVFSLASSSSAPAGPHPTGTAGAENGLPAAQALREMARKVAAAVSVLDASGKEPKIQSIPS